MANIFIFIITVRVSMIHSSFSTVINTKIHEKLPKHHIVKTMTQFVEETILTENVLCNE